MIINNIPNKESKVTINTNLLTNWYFANPVNRRGGFCFVPAGAKDYTDSELTAPSGTLMTPCPVTIVDDVYSYYTVGSYTAYVSTDNVQYGYYQAGATIDRWYLQGEHSISLTDAGLKVTCSGGASQNYILKQFHNLELGKTYTLSALIVENTTIEGVSTRYAGLASVPLVGTGVVSRTFTYTEDILTDGVGIQFDNRSTDNGNYFIVSAIKLEYGDTQSLAYQDSDGSWKLYEIPSYEEEYAKCVTIEPKVFNDNLLMNWYFGNPVNRKNGYYVPIGIPAWKDTAMSDSSGNTLSAYPVTIVNSTYASFTGAGGSTLYVSTANVKKGYVGLTTYPWSIDRWLARGSLVTVLDNGINVSTGSQDINNAGFQTTIENPKLLVGKEVTLSFLITENNATSNIVFGIFYGAGAVNMTSWAISYVSIPAGATGLFSITGTLPDMGDYKAMNPSIRMQGTQNGDFTLLAAKLELGNAQTLAHQSSDGEWVLNEIPDYQEMYEQCSIYPIEAEQSYISSEGFVPMSGHVQMTGSLKVTPSTDYTTQRVRNVAITSANVTAGTTSLANGSILLKYS